MATKTEQRWIVKNGKQFIAHCSPSPAVPTGMFWTGDRELAMEYTRRDVAVAIKDKMGGEVEAL